MMKTFMGRLKVSVKWFLPFYLFTFLPLLSCSKDSSEEDEFANWEERNDAYINKLASSQMKKIKAFTMDPSTTGKNNDYIYVEVLEEGNGTESPLFTDTVRIAYRGRLIPTESYPLGQVFDETYDGDFSWRTAGMQDVCCNAVVTGFSTALMQMHVGDRWRVHIPYTLGYGTSSKNSIEGYSTLVFELALSDFWHPGDSRPDFKARAQE